MRRPALLAVLIPLFAHAGEPPAEDAWSKYDFVAGDKLLFFDDFRKEEKKADPLKRLKNVSERIDLQDRPDGRWLRCRPPCSFEVILPEKLPERFTIDFDLYGPGSNGVTFTTVKTDGTPLDVPVTATSSPSTLGFGNGGDDDRSNEIDRIPGIDDTKPMRFAWSFDGGNGKAYAAHFTGLTAGNLPMARTSRVRFDFLGGDDPTLIDQNIPVFLTNLRIAAGGIPVTFEELSKKGRLVLQGILFDTGSARIRPESTPTLTAVARMLTGNPELKLVVEGHTDNHGGAPANLTLSEKRAAAVKEWLVTKHEIDASRLAAKGFGQTKPAAPNETAEGRQANRRVELAKQ